MASEIYYAFHINSNDEVLIGLLSAFPFESFEEEDISIIGYIPKSLCPPSLKQEVGEIIEKFSSYEIKTIQPQNWNAIWESSFQPVQVHNFCHVRADFHTENQAFKYDIIINPKMAFGTGHHETTFMMIERMSEIDFKNKKVFDFGCGTGVLAILASKMGASHIDAIDIEEESYLNTQENATINKVHNVSSYCGEISGLESKLYHIILANINRNVLLNTADELKDRLSSNGMLVLSGILIEDKAKLVSQYQTKGFELIEEKSKGNWVCLTFTH